jgi:uncharacterized protein YndB with AHSA1/START domain
MSKETSSITIQAPATKVWDVLTKPALVKQWQYGSDIETDWQVGNSIRFKSEWNGKIYEQWGSIIELKLYSLIKYSLFAPSPGVEDKPENYFIMTYQLKENNNTTTLEIIKEDNNPESHTENESEENSILTTLKNLAEK